MNKNIKKIIMAMIFGLLMFSLTACRSNEESIEKDRSSNTSQVEENNDTLLNIDGKKVLITYFAEAENSEVDVVSSASVVTIDGEMKGRIRALADMIQTETGGDLFSIQTSVEYPADTAELVDFAAEEQDEEVRPELISKLENLDDYDVIFVGYPNWWYDMPMVMYSFFEEYDLSEKIIIPFSSHNGSGFSDTIETIQELEPGADVLKDGFTVNERDVEDAKSDITSWLKDLGF